MNSNASSLINECRETAETCRAWIEFLQSPGFNKLFHHGLRVCENWYGRMGDLSLEFPAVNDQKTMREAIGDALRAPYEVEPDPTLFKRRALFDKMAYATFPLSWFVETTSDAKVTFSLPLPMVFAVSSFRFKRCRKVGHDGWWGRMYLVDGRVERARGFDHEVDEVLSPESSTREEMFETLMTQIRERQDECLFTITGDSLIEAMIKAESDNLLLQA